MKRNIWDGNADVTTMLRSDRALVFISVFVCALLATFIPSVSAQAETEDGYLHERMLGGQYSSTLSQGPYALIDAESGDDGETCSGVLVGPKEILTAAHCVAAARGETLFQPNQYTVTVGGAAYSVSATYYHSSYKPNAEVNDASSRYDLGMLILSTDVAGATPVPIAAGAPAQVGEQLTMYGYGTNENSSYYDTDYLAYGKFGSVVVTRVRSGVFNSRYTAGHVVSCSGDSGGALVRESGDSKAVLGVVSAGTTGDNRTGRCTGTVGSESDTYVDLQSAASRAFLAQFPEIVYSSGSVPGGGSPDLSAFESALTSAIGKLRAANKTNRLTRIHTVASFVRTTLAKYDSLVPASNAIIFDKATKALAEARSARKITSAMRYLNGAIRNLKVLASTV